MRRLLDQQNDPVGLDRVVSLAHRHLELDVVYVAELTPAGHVYRAAAGDLSSFKITVDERPVAEAIYCPQLLAGEIPGVIPDTTAHPCAAGLPATRAARVGSFIGVPLSLSDGTPYGALCGVSHAPDPTLAERDVRFMAMLAEILIDDLDSQRGQEELHAQFLRMIETEAVAVAYQPIMHVRSQRCLGVEALARFPEPFPRPDLTFAAARTVGLALELERLVISRAWRVLPQLGANQFLAVNVSPEALVELAHRANMREDIALTQLVVEVTEHYEVDSYAALHAELKPLRRRGLRIAVDDAGAGYASLRHVLELRPDFIKMDRSLIHGLSDDRARRLAVKAFLSLARDLGSRVVAEGVERAADLAAVRDLGLHAVQGYLLGAPSTSPDALAGWLASPEPQPAQRVLLGV